MLRRHLDARDILVKREQAASPPRSTRAAHARACRLPGEPEQRRGRGQRRLGIAPFAVACRIASARSDARSRKRASSSAWKAARRSMSARMRDKRLLVVDEQVSGRGAHEHLDAGSAWKPLEPRQLLDILPRGADIEGEVAVHAPAPARDLVGERLRAHRRRLGVRHLEHGGDAAKHRGPAAGFEIFLVLEPRLAEMHLGVDHAGQHVQAGGVECPARVLGGQRANRDDSAVFHADIGRAFARMVDEGRAFDEEIECFGQDRLASACRLTPAR